MKMAKPSEQDIDAAGDLMSILHDIDKGYYPERGAKEGAPTWFDEEDPEHLRAFYDAVKATLDKGPGYPGRVIGGMCYVIMWDKNEIVDPKSDTIDLHPKIVKALQQSEESAATQAPAIAAEPGLPPEATEKKAILSLSLRADSGYMSDEKHRISADQWGRILKIANEKDGQATSSAASQTKGGEHA